MNDDRAAVGLDNEPDHTHPFQVPGIADLLQLSRALGGGSYPGLGSGQQDTMPLVDSVAPGFPLNLPFVIPANQVKQQSVQLSFQPQAFRTYVSASGHTHAGDTVASDGTAGSTHAHAGDSVATLSITLATDSVNHDHSHNHVGGGDHSHSIGIAHGSNSNAMSLDATTGIQASGFGGSVQTGSTALATDATGISAAHVHSNTAHTHSSTSNTGNESSHAHSHGHTPGTTGSAGTAAGVQEGTSPDAMHVMVDGTDVTTQLGGPFSSAMTELDITPYVGPGVGLHNVQVTTATNLGRIAGFVRNRSVVNNLALM